MNHKKNTKIVFTVIIFLIGVSVIVYAFLINNDSQSSIISPLKNNKNQQISASTILDRETQIGSMYQYSLTNGSKYLNKVYGFKSNPAEFDNQNYSEEYENNFSSLVLYSYENGNTDYALKTQMYFRENEGENTKYENSYLYVKDTENNNRISAYHSYWIDSNETEHDDSYWHYSYDENNKLTEMSDGSRKHKYFYYDNYGILSEIVNDDGSDSETIYYIYEKDEQGNITKITKSKRNQYYKRFYEYEYDTNNNITKESYSFLNDNEEIQLLKTTSYSYDENKNITRISVEEYSEFTGECNNTQTTTYYYDNNNNLSEATVSDKYSTTYMIFEYTDTPTTYYVENQ